MSRRAALVALTLVESATLLIGTARALTVEPRPSVPVVVRAAEGTAPVPVVLPRAAAVRRPPAPRKAVAPAHHKTVVRTEPRVVPVTSTTRRTSTAMSSPLQLMDSAISRIPGYHTGDAVWALTPGLAHWGLADLNSGVVYISPDVPSNRMYDVVAHEWSHVLSMKDYGFDVVSALAALDSYFGATGQDGAEIAADCMAKELGATWTHYTPCNDAHWRAGARQLLSHQRV